MKASLELKDFFHPLAGVSPTNFVTCLNFFSLRLTGYPCSGVANLKKGNVT
jgi:hypothetical protein